MATVIEQIEANIAKAAVKLVQDIALLAKLRTQVPLLKTKKDQLMTSMGVINSHYNLLVDRYIKAKNTFTASGWIKNDANIALYNAYGGKPVEGLYKESVAAKVVVDKEFAKWAAADREWKAEDKKLIAAFQAEQAGKQNLINLKNSLAKEKAKPDTSVAKAAAQAEINKATAAYEKVKQDSAAVKASMLGLEATFKATLAAYTKAHTATLKSQGLYNAAKAKAAVRNATALVKQQAAQALTKLNADIAIEIPANDAYKVAALAKSNAQLAITKFVQTEAVAKAAVTKAIAALAKIK